MTELKATIFGEKSQILSVKNGLKEVVTIKDGENIRRFLVVIQKTILQLRIRSTDILLLKWI